MKSTIEDEGLKKKLGEKYQEIKDKLIQAEEVLQVVAVTKDEYEKALKEENFINPIMQNIVKEGGGESIPRHRHNNNPKISMQLSKYRGD